MIAAAMLLVSGAVMAQSTYKAADGTEYEFNKHAFITLQGGMQYTLGEAGFSDLLSPNFQLGVGYQFSPVLAARIQANGIQSKGGWNGFQLANEAPHTETYKFNNIAPGIDVMFNLSNLICGYNPTRLLNVTAFLGGGANIAWGNDDANAIGANLMAANLPVGAYNLEYLWDGSKIRPFGRGGIELGFRLSDKLSLLVEGNANLLSDKFNSKKAGNADWYFNGLIGLRFNLGSTYTKREPVVETPPTTPTETIPVVPVVTTPEKPKPPVVVETVEPLRRDIFFLINKYEIRPEEKTKVADIAAYLNKYPKAKVALCGYADAQTGNDQINDRLGLQRVTVVKDMLVKEFNIPEDRITTDSKGAREQPFEVNEQNRVTIAIAE